MKKKMIVLLLLCLCLLAGCGSAEDTQEQTETTAETEAVEAETEQEQETDAEPVIGKISAIGDSYLTVLVYEADTEVTDFSALDVAALTQTGDEDYIYLYSDTVYYAVQDGLLMGATQDDLTLDTVVAVATDADGVQEIYIFQAADETETVSYDTLVAKVTAVNEDGSFELEEYEITEGTDSTITDYTAVAVEGYIATGLMQTYTAPENSVVTLVDGENLTSLSSSLIIAGDTLVIYTDESGTEHIYIYPEQTDTEE